MMNEFGQLQDKLEELQVDITDLQVAAVPAVASLCVFVIDVM